MFWEVVNLLAIAINYDKSLDDAYYVSEVQRCMYMESSMISCAFMLLTSHLPIVFNRVSTRELLHNSFFPQFALRPICFHLGIFRHV
jgi:hypothetical protein